MELKDLESKLRKNVPVISKYGPMTPRNLTNCVKKISEEEGCWYWTGCKTQLSNSYVSKIRYNNNPVKVSLLLYHNFIEDIPDNLTNIKNTCSTEDECINPWHMEIKDLKKTSELKIKESITTLGSKVDKLTFDVENFDSLKFLISLRRFEIPKIGKLNEMDDSYIQNLINLIEFPLPQDISTKCWMWNGRKRKIDERHTNREHGIRKFCGKDVYIHRLFYHNFVKDVPEYNSKIIENQVNHTCDSNGKQNGNCVNPWHMYLGTGYENIYDSHKDKTSFTLNPVKGPKHYKTKLTTYQVKELRRLREEEKTTYKKLGKMFGIHPSYASEIYKNYARKEC